MEMVKVSCKINGPTPMAFDLDVPKEQAALVQGLSLSLEHESARPTFNFGKFLAAALQLFVAIASGNPVGIASAIAALLAAITGA